MKCVFVKVRHSPDTESGPEILVKMGDLDKKNAEAKWDHWVEMEKELVDGKYYEGLNVRTACLLEKGE